jgi:hypothetical protein
LIFTVFCSSAMAAPQPSAGRKRIVAAGQAGRQGAPADKSGSAASPFDASAAAGSADGLTARQMQYEANKHFLISKFSQSARARATRAPQSQFGKGIASGARRRYLSNR